MTHLPLTLGMALVLTLVNVPALHAQVELKDPAVIKLQSLGAVVTLCPDKCYLPGVRVSFRDDKVTDEHLALLSQIATLREVDLSRQEITNRGMIHIGKLTGLTKLDLGYTKITDEGLVHLKNLKELRWLNLERPCKDNRYWLTDACMDHLQGLSKLEYVNLDWGHLTDASLDRLQKMTHLREIRLGVQSMSKDAPSRLRKAMPMTKVDGI